MRYLREILESVEDNKSFPGKDDFVNYDREMISVRKNERPDFGIQLIWDCGKLISDNMSLIKDVFAKFKCPATNGLWRKMTGLSTVVSKNRYGHMTVSLCIHCEDTVYSVGGREITGNRYIPQCGILGQYGSVTTAKNVAYYFLKQFSDDKNKFTKLLKFILDNNYPVYADTEF